MNSQTLLPDLFQLRTLLSVSAHWRWLLSQGEGRMFGLERLCSPHFYFNLVAFIWTYFTGQSLKGCIMAQSMSIWKWSITYMLHPQPRKWVNVFSDSCQSYQEYWPPSLLGISWFLVLQSCHLPPLCFFRSFYSLEHICAFFFFFFAFFLPFPPLIFILVISLFDLNCY